MGFFVCVAQWHGVHIGCKLISLGYVNDNFCYQLAAIKKWKLRPRTLANRPLCCGQLASVIRVIRALFALGPPTD